MVSVDSRTTRPADLFPPISLEEWEDTKQTLPRGTTACLWLERSRETMTLWKHDYTPVCFYTQYV
jgi:hypothetical protein